jgi:hypothetical protein
LGGGNFVTALLTVLLGFTYCFYCLLCRKKAFLFAVILQVILISGFFISVLAPGNAVRQAKHQKPGVIHAILYSFGQAGIDVRHWTTVTVILVVILFVPILYRIAGRSGLYFRLPGLFTTFTLLLFVAQNVPPYYAMSWAGDGRLRDIVYYSYFWLLLVNEFYILGWLREKIPKLPGICRVLDKRIHLRELCKATFCIAVAGGAIALFLIIFIPGIFAKTASGKCRTSLIDGSAQKYGYQMNERISLYNNKNITDVIVPELESRPYPVYLDDISDNPEAGNNLVIKSYYLKKSVETFIAD